METAETKLKYALEVRNVSQAYDQRVIISGIDLKVRESEFVTIIGPTGCGKSTLLRSILGSEKPAGGTILVGGNVVTEPDRDRGIVFQKYSLFPDKTVKQNVMFGLELEYYSLSGMAFQKLTFGLYKHNKQKEFEDRAKDFLDKVGLWEARDNSMYELSGGMAQRVAIAQALIMEPKILLMDEPFGALDASTREAMQVFILNQWKEYRPTIFFVTHDLEEALFLGTRLVTLSPYYEKVNGMAGSKIVTDIALPWMHPRPTSVKSSPEFGQLLQKVRRDGLDPKYLQSIREFDLTHQDAQKILY